MLQRPFFNIFRHFPVKFGHRRRRSAELMFFIARTDEKPGRSEAWRTDFDLERRQGPHRARAGGRTPNGSEAGLNSKGGVSPRSRRLEPGKNGK